jgi:hypothetical protein
VSCSCEHDRWTPPTTRAIEPWMRHETDIRDQLELIKVDGSKWMSVYRCRECGRYWCQDSMMSGHADLSYVYPIHTDDPVGWLDAAQNLH